ncbi:hypothetical protein YDYSG_62530 [Paenibacillus tyrfis]|nr:hypothetical protein YDYSG_62530 [Paenibacillus tyrfis]
MEFEKGQTESRLVIRLVRDYFLGDRGYNVMHDHHGSFSLFAIGFPPHSTYNILISNRNIQIKARENK